MSKVQAGAGLRALSVAALIALVGCGGVSQVTKERVSRSETAVQQAQQTIGTQEVGQIELQRAKENLEYAREALRKENEKAAVRAAQRAELNAELAVAKSQSAAARRAADELLASIQTLRQEAERGNVSATDQQ